MSLNKRFLIASRMTTFLRKKFPKKLRLLGLKIKQGAAKAQHPGTSSKRNKKGISGAELKI